MKSFIFSNSSKNLPIFAHQFGSQGPKVLVLGGVHGDEVEGVAVGLKLLETFQSSFTYKLNLTIVPQFNIDGILAGTRGNGNLVDLNRNLPTSDWTNDIKEKKYFPGPCAGSESENQGLVSWIKTNKPSYILTLHSWKPLLNVNGRCHQEAEILKKMTGYEITEDIGYPTPGSLGTYCGVERDIPTLTYEIERGMPLEKATQLHVPAILESLKVTEQRAYSS